MYVHAEGFFTQTEDWLTGLIVKTDFPLNPSTVNGAQAQDEYKRTRSGLYPC